MDTTSFTVTNGKPDQIESLYINLNKGKIKACLSVLAFVDNDTKQYIAYIPSLHISGYGATEQKAMEMLKYSLDNFGNYIASLPADKVSLELASYGWEKTIFNKEYSRKFAAGDSTLSGYNAENNKIEHLTLQAA